MTHTQILRQGQLYVHNPQEVEPKEEDFVYSPEPEQAQVIKNKFISKTRGGNNRAKATFSGPLYES